MKGYVGAVLLTITGLTACGPHEAEQVQVQPEQYQVASAEQLQQRFSALNRQLEADFQQFKQLESIAFAQQFPLDADNLMTLNQHLVSSTALKPTKAGYCDMMNGYFAEMYRLGHYNLELLDQIQLPQAQQENLKQNFANADNFYNFILNRYTSYRQVQQTMNYGCNLKAALQ
ncbi:hypothetical protein [Acinetobacter indicus]|uniref:Uncharacterized protein n=1 Tax=Acinetobacter indicus CIP 110367 TaxID=1341679 RepID=V2UDA5_9GAMM|nr:hypothetical protein [Acinetobacter indicus]EPF72806.1 hypothetical protein F956_01476 [Acinetobacter indicus ANC 4215]ESK48512.1 hypothetical protein P253_01156 [Acinetobacter indicus CIP 110367]